MYTVTSIFNSEYRIKGSKFQGFLCPSTNLSEAERNLELIRKKHPTATHHCYAYLIKPNEPEEFASDAGEPNGTAGLPILNSLKSFHLMNVILIVVRYYGGTKLGKPGLIEAYQTTSQKTIESAHLKELIQIKTYRIVYDYSQQSLINKWKNQFSWTELESSYLDKVELTIGCPREKTGSFEKAISSHEHELITFEAMEESFHIRQ